jgi:hypothetical protein
MDAETPRLSAEGTRGRHVYKHKSLFRECERGFRYEN